MIPSGGVIETGSNMRILKLPVEIDDKIVLEYLGKIQQKPHSMCWGELKNALKNHLIL